jgi:hypothetical protein
MELSEFNNQYFESFPTPRPHSVHLFTLTRSAVEPYFSKNLIAHNSERPSHHEFVL